MLEFHLKHRKEKIIVELPDGAREISIIKPANGGLFWVVTFKVDGVFKVKKTDIPIAKELRVISHGVKFLQNPKESKRREFRQITCGEQDVTFED